MKAKVKARSVKYSDRPTDTVGQDKVPEGRKIGSQEAPIPVPLKVKPDLEEGEEVGSTDSEESEMPKYSKIADAIMKSSFTELKVEEREIYESLLPPFDYEDLFQSEVKQAVPFDANIWAEFRTKTTRDDMDIQEFAGPPVDERGRDNIKWQIYAFCVQVHSYCGQVLPSYRDSNMNWDQEKFKKRLDHVVDLPAATIQWLDMQRRWFSERVYKQYTLAKGIDALKNGWTPPPVG